MSRPNAKTAARIAALFSYASTYVVIGLYVGSIVALLLTLGLTGILAGYVFIVATVAFAIKLGLIPALAAACIASSARAHIWPIAIQVLYAAILGSLATLAYVAWLNAADWSGVGKKLDYRTLGIVGAVAGAASQLAANMMMRKGAPTIARWLSGERVRNL